MLSCKTSTVIDDTVADPSTLARRRRSSKALTFYRDNQLAYGSLPGQWDAQESTALIAQLLPPEEDTPKWPRTSLIVAS